MQGAIATANSRESSYAKLASEGGLALASKRPVPEACTPSIDSNSLPVARRLLISKQLLARQESLVEAVTGLATTCEEIGASEFDENSEARKERVATGARQKISECRSLRSLIDNHKSWSERRREIIVDTRNIELDKLEQTHWSDSLNYSNVSNNSEIDCLDKNHNNINQSAGYEPSSKLAAKSTKESLSGGRKQSAPEQQHYQAAKLDEHTASGKIPRQVNIREDNEDIERFESGASADRDATRAKGTKPPSFGLAPCKLTRLPYFSYNGKARNVDLVSSADRAPAAVVGPERYASRGSEDSGGGATSSTGSSASSVNSSQRSISSLTSHSRIPKLASRSGKPSNSINKEGPWSAGRRFLSYSNISNLFPSKLMTDSPFAAARSKQFRFGSEERTRTTTPAPASTAVGAGARNSRLASSALNRRNSITARGGTTAEHLKAGQAGNRSTNSLNASPISPTSDSSGNRMRRQNNASFGINGNNPNASATGAPASHKYLGARPASVAGGGPLTRQQRSPSASSLHYPHSSGLSPYGSAPPPPVDPDCPVHGYWPLSKSQQHLANQWDQQLPDLLYDPYPPAPFMRDPYENPARVPLYSPGGSHIGHHRASGNLFAGTKRAYHQPSNGAGAGAYYNNSSRFSLYHSPSRADGQRSSLAPASEQVRRILGYQPHARPIHLHPQWAYSRPFIQLLGTGPRSPSLVDLDELDANGQPIIRPRYEIYNQLQETQAIRAVDFHPSGEVYAVGSNSRTLHICAYPADYELRHFNPSEHESVQKPRVLFKFLQLHRGSIYCVAFNASGQLLATGSNDQTVQIVRYNSTTHSPDGDEYRLTMHDGTVRDLCFIDDQTSGSSLLLSAGGGDNKIYVTDCDTITPYQSMAGHTQPVMALHHAGGANFVSASQDRTLRFWDLRTRACTSIVSAPPASAIPVATMQQQQSQQTTKQSPASNWSGGPGAPVCSVKVDPSGRLMASGHSDSICMLYDIRGARMIQAFRAHEDEIRTVSFSPKSYFLLTGGYDGRIVLTDLQGDLTQQLPQVCVAESDDKIVQSKWHPSDFTFVTTSADKTATLWALPVE